ncbi:MAG: hypothetical protein U0514_00640 [Candidatus Andersenbacteria bacterium]
MRKMRVLIIEDDHDVQSSYRELLSTHVNLTQVFTIEEATVALGPLEVTRFDLIAFDGLVPCSTACPDKRIEDMTALVRAIRSRQHVHRVATSNSKNFRDALLEAGCTVAVFPKNELPRLILDICEASREEQADHDRHATDAFGPGPIN